MSSLYELEGMYLSLLEMAQDGDVDEQIFMDTLEGLDGEIEVKADAYAKIIAQLEANANELDVIIKRLQARKATMLNNADRMKKSLFSVMVNTGKRKFKTLLFSFGIQKNPPSLVLDGDVPEEYLIPQEPKVNTAALKERLKRGETFEFAHLAQSEGLRIR